MITLIIFLVLAILGFGYHFVYYAILAKQKYDSHKASKWRGGNKWFELYAGESIICGIGTVALIVLLILTIVE